MHTGALEGTLPAPRGSAYLQGFQLLATPTLPTQLIVVDSSRVNPSQARGWVLVAQAYISYLGGHGRRITYSRPVRARGFLTVYHHHLHSVSVCHSMCGSQSTTSGSLFSATTWGPGLRPWCQALQHVPFLSHLTSPGSLEFVVVFTSVS